MKKVIGGVIGMLLFAAPSLAATWDIYQEVLYLYLTGPGAQTSDYLRSVDDAVEPVMESTVAFFGPHDIYTVTSGDGDILAKIQYSPVQKQGWTRDNLAAGDS